MVVGVGRMGRNHLRVLGHHPGYEVTAVVDPSAEVEACPEVQALLPRPPRYPELAGVPGSLYDAVVVATPPAAHLDVAKVAARAGKALLVEKPLGRTYAECCALQKAASDAGVALAVGHVERFNPAVRKLADLLVSGDMGQALTFRSLRVGGYPSDAAGGDNVLLDLAVHDIDILRHLLGPLELLRSLCQSKVHAGVLDTAEIVLRSEAGVTANVGVSWVTPTKARTLEARGTRGSFLVDYMLQTCRTPERVLELPAVDSLAAQLDAFRELVLGRPSSRLCSGADGACAVLLAERAIGEGLDRGEGPPSRRANDAPLPLPLPGRGWPPADAAWV